MYKDKDKQREANRERQRRYKARQKALPEQGVTEGVTDAERKQIEKDMIAIGLTPISDQDFTKLLSKAGPGHVRVSKPGDDDYVPMCETTRRFIDG